MSKMTITEALQEIKTINARIGKKRSAIPQYIVRDSRIRDPFEADGGVANWIKQERQALGDLEKRIIAIRVEIQRSNLASTVTVQGRSWTVSEWLTWRREVAKGQQAFLQLISGAIMSARNTVQQKGGKVIAAAAASATINLDKEAPIEALVSVDEMAVLKEIEQMETTLGDLDGKLSLFNATTTIDV